MLKTLGADKQPTEHVERIVRQVECEIFKYVDPKFPSATQLQLSLVKTKDGGSGLASHPRAISKSMHHIPAPKDHDHKTIVKPSSQQSIKITGKKEHPLEKQHSLPDHHTHPGGFDDPSPPKSAEEYGCFVPPKSLLHAPTIHQCKSKRKDSSTEDEKLSTKKIVQRQPRRKKLEDICSELYETIRKNENSSSNSITISPQDPPLTKQQSSVNSKPIKSTTIIKKKLPKAPKFFDFMRELGPSLAPIPIEENLEKSQNIPPEIYIVSYHVFIEMGIHYVVKMTINGKTYEAVIFRKEIPPTTNLKSITEL